MLLLIVLTLKGSIAISPPTPPMPTPGGSGSGVAEYSYVNHKKDDKDKLDKILKEDSETIAIVQLTLKHFII